VINKTWTKSFIEQLAKGIADVLRETGTAFIGGDFGTSDRWRYTGSVIGEMEGNPMLRSSAKIGDAIFITGNIGIGNVEAALKLYSNHPVIKNITNRFKNRFKLRSKEVQLIKKYSHCCIDTSDGSYNALSTITELSNAGFEVNSLPYDQQGLLLSKFLHVPKELLFLGECGEYELLFTINREKQEEFIQEAEKHHLSFYKIGEIKDSNVKLLYDKRKKIDLCTYKCSARDFENPKEYLKEVIKFVDML
jgi:thiamine-monophosphate kinase